MPTEKTVVENQNPTLSDPVELRASLVEGYSHSTIDNVLPKFVQKLDELAHIPTNHEVVAMSSELRKMCIEYCVDGGCGGGTIALYLVDHDPLIEESVPILNRASFLNYIEESYPDKEKARESVQFEMMDIKSFRLTDLVRDSQGESGAEIVLRRFARQVTEKAEELNQNILPLLSLKEGRVTPARYGGDEFVLAYENIPSQVPSTFPESCPQDFVEHCKNFTDFREAVRCYLTGEKPYESGDARVTSVEGIFSLDGVIVEQPIKLKKGHGLEGVFGIPEDETKREIFWHKLHRGVLLREDQIDPSESQGVDFEISSPQEVQSALESINKITGNNENLKQMVSFAKEIAKNLDEGAQESFYIEFENFLRNTVCDRLLSADVETMRAFAQEHISHPFSQIYVLDAPIKEVNDLYGLGAGDQIIEALWEKINQPGESPNVRSTEQELSSIPGMRFFRRGGTFLIGENGEGGLTQEQKERLANIESISIKVRDKDIEVPVSFYTMKPERGYSPKTTAEISNVVDNLLEGTRQDLHETQIKKLIADVDALKEQGPNQNVNLYDQMVPLENLAGGEETLNNENFYLIFLLGGDRSEERVIAAGRTIQRMRERVLKSGSLEDLAKLDMINSLLGQALIKKRELQTQTEQLAEGA